MKWYAYCTNCKNYVFEANNGNFVECQAKIHQKEKQHEIIVGYKLKEVQK